MYQFTITNVHCSIANAIRRTLLADIPIIVFRTMPSSHDRCTIFHNGSSLTDEVIKHRLSCVPIVANPDKFDFHNYIAEIDVVNNSNTNLYVTSNDIKVKNKITNEEETIVLFPPNEITGDYIDLVLLPPKKKLKLQCAFEIGTAKENGAFNAVSCATYACTIDPALLEEKMALFRSTLPANADVAFELENWKLLDGQRCIVENSFEFKLQSVGIYSNKELMRIACDVLIRRFTNVNFVVTKTETTLSNGFDVTLVGEDYTLGKALEYALYTKLYPHILCFCGFKMEHPHDANSLLRVAYVKPENEGVLYSHIKQCLDECIFKFKEIQNMFV